MHHFFRKFGWVIAATIVIAAAVVAWAQDEPVTVAKGEKDVVAKPASGVSAPTPVMDGETLPTMSSPRLPMRLLPPGIQLCQALSPAAPHPIWGVDSAAGGPCAEIGWDARGMIPWQEFAQGEYVGHARTAHVPEYRLRADDVVAVYYRRTREEISRPYQFEVGDRIRVESMTAGNNAAGGPTGGGTVTDDISRDLVIQPDGTITLPLLGQVRAARLTVTELQHELEERYKKYFRVPSITVTPTSVNTRLEDLLNTVDSRSGIAGGIHLAVHVTPSGEIQLPGIRSVFVQGLTLEEVRREVDAQYDATIPGVAVTMVLTERAPRFFYVLGEVGQAGRFEMVGPTTVTMAISMAGGWTAGSNLRQVVVFRRGDDWRLMATMLDVRGALYGRRPVPADEIWLNDSDIILVPKTPIEQIDEFIEQVFVRGLYGLVPREVIWNFNTGTSL